MALAITDNNFEELLQSGKPLVIDFWATWCGPCKQIGPFIEELASEYEGKVTVGKCDIEENDDLVGKYGIRNIPTVLFIKDGQIVDKQVGAAAKNIFQTKIDALL